MNGYEDEQRVDLSELAHWFSDDRRFVNLMTAKNVVVDASQGVIVGGWDALILQVVE